MNIERVLAIIVGVGLVGWVLDAAIRNFMLPRSSRVRLTGWVAKAVAWPLHKVASPRRSYRFRDRVLAMRSPLTLLAFQATWLFVVFVGFALIFWGVAGIGWREAIRESGSALFTIGFATPEGGVPLFLVFTEAIIGLTLMALLISYLPTIYQAFSRREATVALLELRAGTPPTAACLLGWLNHDGSVQNDDQQWAAWEQWFVEIEESHTSLPILSFFRSPQPGRSWVTAADLILDAAAVIISGRGPIIPVRWLA